MPLFLERLHWSQVRSAGMPRPFQDQPMLSGPGGAGPSIVWTTCLLMIHVERRRPRGISWRTNLHPLRNPPSVVEEVLERIVFDLGGDGVVRMQDVPAAHFEHGSDLAVEFLVNGGAVV